VRTLHPSVFGAVQRAAQPRVIELWEQNPCPEARRRGGRGLSMAATSGPRAPVDQVPLAEEAPVVRVESQFQAGEYDIVVLSASDSLVLETWLRQQQYAVPEGASSAFRPYL